MRVVLRGTGGPAGWPVPGCRCASCGRVRTARSPTEVLIDGTPLGSTLPYGYRVREDASGWDVTAPDGMRLLCAAGQGRAPAGQGDYDVVLLDLLGRPDHLGVLRRLGHVHDRTQVIAVHLDHRVTPAELVRRLGFWGARAVPDGTELPTVVRDARAEVPRRTLILGGARSGKSAEAELRLLAEPYVTYVATGPAGLDDPDWQARVQAHRARRPAHWETVETTDLAGLLRESNATLLIDGLGTWLAAVLDEHDAWHGDTLAVDRRIDDLLTAWRQTSARVVAVSEEVGLGVVPATASGRTFRDILGNINQRLAAESEDVALVVAGVIVGISE